MKKKSPVSTRPENVDITVERMVALAEKLISEPTPTMIYVSQARCDQILKIAKKQIVHTLHGLEIRVQGEMSNDAVAIRYSDGTTKYFDL